MRFTTALPARSDRWRAWREVRAHGGRCWRRRGPASGRRAAGRGRLSPGARARPPGWELQTAAGAAGRHPQTGRTATTAREADRPGVVVQQACQIVIEPLVAANLQHTSYGFRPRRSATQAVQGVKEPRGSNGSAVDVDIERVFDTIDPDLLRRCVARRISDRRVLNRRRQWCKQGWWKKVSGARARLGHPKGAS